jgi:PadR family transcriptional regulator PadR
MAKLRAQPSEGEQPDRWEAQLRKGALEMAVLASLWRGRLYGLEIIRFLENHSQLILAEGTIYPILGRLRAEGLLTSEWVEAEAGHPRKYYSLTGEGRKRLCLMAEAWVSFSQGLSQLLEPVLLHPSDQDLSLHTSEQRSLAGDPESVETPALETKEIPQ